jgi:hypothetical protein
MQKMTAILAPKTLKTGRWHKKSGRTEQSGYQFKKYHPACKECPVKHLCTSRPAGEKSIRPVREKR